MKFYSRTWHLKIDVNEVIDIINEGQDNFCCPFSNHASYLNIYQGKDCDVQFYNLQHCDYEGEPNKEGERYIRYLMSIEKKQNKTETYDFLKNGFDRFTIETNEENFRLPDDNPKVVKLLNKLQTMWGYDASSRPSGDIFRARIVKLPAGGIMPYHRDETSNDNIRVICPIITNDDVLNGFRDRDEDCERYYTLPATGHFYHFDDHKIEHAVFNYSNQDRYALIFTVKNIDNMKEWDRGYYKNKQFWKARSHGV